MRHNPLVVSKSHFSSGGDARSLGLLLTLRRVSALGLGVWLRAEPKLYRALSEDAWGSAVANMDAEGVRDHLRSWSWDQHSKPPGGFIEIVDILYRTGVDGRGLLFLRQSQKNGRGVADVRDLLQHEAVGIVAPTIAVTISGARRTSLYAKDQVCMM